MRLQNILLTAILGSLVYCGPAAALCTSYPNTLTNGTVADGGQTMANFNCAALTSGATLNGVTLTGATTLTGPSTFTGATTVVTVASTNNGGWDAIAYTGKNSTGTANNWLVGPNVSADNVYQIANGTTASKTVLVNVTSSGSLGVGTTSPATKLAVVGDIRVGTSGTNGCVQNFAGTALTGTCSSDAALKTVVGNVPQLLGKFGKLKLVQFRWNKKAYEIYRYSTSALNTGLIAQAVELQFPELVSTDSKGFRQIDYTTLSLYGLQATIELNRAKDLQTELLQRQGKELADLKAAISMLQSANEKQGRTIGTLQNQLRTASAAEHAEVEVLRAQMDALERRASIRTAQR